MRSLYCLGILLIPSAIIINTHEMLSDSIRPMFNLILASLGGALFLAWLILRQAERRRNSKVLQYLLVFMGIFVFFSSWNVLWKASEELLSSYYERRGETDVADGFNYFYPGASGMGYANGFTSFPIDVREVLIFGGFPALFLVMPLGLILTFRNQQGEQSVPPKSDRAGG